MRTSARGVSASTSRSRCCALWTEPVVTFNGRWHQIDAAGINPLLVQRPVPIWFGGETESAVRRAARVDNNGEVLVSGGDARVEVYTPATRSFHTVDGSVGVGRAFTTTTLLHNGRVIIVRGYDERINPTAETSVYEPRR